MTRRALLLTVVLLLAGACGVRADHEPQAIAPQDVPGQLLDPNPSSSTTLPESAGTTTVPVYLLVETDDGVRLVPRDREVTDAGDPDERLAALFLGASADEVNDGITTGIPADTKLLGVTTDEEAGEVTIDVSNDIFSIEGPALAQAFAQIVWTATGPGFPRVRFAVDGEPTPVLDGEGNNQDGPVQRSNYDNLRPLS